MKIIEHNHFICHYYDLKAYTTNASQNWQEEIIAKGGSETYPITIPAMSIVTYVGSIQ